MPIAVKLMGLDKKDARVVAFTNNDKTVAFVPMKHVGPQEFYGDVKKILDSLHAEGYVAYLESTRVTDSLSKDEKELLYIKLRKMLGTHLGKGGYLDTINHRLAGRRYKNRHNLVNQPRYRLMGSDSINDRIVDIPMNRIIAEYESRYGELKLNDCDYVLKPEAKYECGKEPGKQVNAVIMGYREQHLATEITNDKNKKIAVIYGALHEPGLLRELHEIDTTWNYRK